MNETKPKQNHEVPERPKEEILTPNTEKEMPPKEVKNITSEILKSLDENYKKPDPPEGKIIKESHNPQKVIPKKIYCKDCVYYIEQSYRLENTTEGEDGRDICGFTLQTDYDPTGRKILKRYGEHEACKKCGRPFYDTRRIVYNKCVAKNADYKCVDFEGKSMWIRF
ncbi:hypothetical protein LCGC14_1547870, partial [marine sediment metagenome]